MSVTSPEESAAPPIPPRAATEESPEPATSARPHRFAIVSPTATLIILTLINFLNYVDRQILAPLVPFLQAPASAGGLGLSDTQTGLLHTAFMIVHSIASIPLGILADRWLRPRVIAIGVGIWSVATAAAGFARNYAQLFVARATVGVGEAAYAPAASSLISDRFDASQRARALGVFQLGMLAGTGVGVVVGALIAKAYGWRDAFFLVGVPGLVLTFAALLVHDRARPVRADRTSLTDLLKHPPVPGTRTAILLVYATGVLITFFVGAVALWGIEFVIRYHYGGDKNHAGIAAALVGGVGLLAGGGGAIVGSIVGDRIERTRPGAGRMTAVGIGALLGAPFAAAALWTSSLPIAIAALGVGVFFVSWYVGPIMAALHDVVPPEHRAAATGAYLFLVHALGDGISPGVVGIINDATSLRTGLLIAVVPMALGGIVAMITARVTARVARPHGPDAR